MILITTKGTTSYRNKIQRDIKSAKQQYIFNKIEDNKNNSKKLWESLKELGYQNKSKVSAKIVLEFEDNRYYENK